MVWNQQRTLLECYEEPCLIGSELLNKAVENRKLLIPRSELPKTNEDDLGIGEFWKRLKDLETETSAPTSELKNCIRCCWIFCNTLKLKCPGSATIERIIKDLGGLRVCPQKISHFGKVKKANRQKVLRKPKDFKVLHPGHTIALDTVEKQRKRPKNVYSNRHRHIHQNHLRHSHQVAFFSNLCPLLFLSHANVPL